LKKYLSKDVDECKKSSSTKIKVRRWTVNCWIVDQN
jgi:hypothetical protein